MLYSVEKVTPVNSAERTARRQPRKAVLLEGDREDEDEDQSHPELGHREAGH